MLWHPFTIVARFHDDSTGWKTLAAINWTPDPFSPQLNGTRIPATQPLEIARQVTSIGDLLNVPAKQQRARARLVREMP